uniref:Fibronectin n=1 Tax=Amphimedon queenslandica TaxID=400682 RepID=A0A1X7TS54_AMPQE
MVIHLYLLNVKLSCMHKMAALSVSLVVLFFLGVSEVISQCPPSSGIYLRHNGNCHSNGSYFPDPSIRPTPLECGLPGATLNGGQWIGPNGVVPCDGGNNANVQCTTGSGASLSVHILSNHGIYLQQPGEGWYKCCLPTNCSDPNTNIIFANIFRYAEIESFTVADLPSDITVYPQAYKLNCTKIGHYGYDISMSIDNTALANYANCNDQYSNCPGTVLVSSTYTVRYTVNITWDGMTVSSGSISQSTTGDQMYQCVLDNPSGGADRTHTLTIKVPATSPSSLTEVYKTATTITVSWTALDSSDADGYVVNVTSDTDTVQTVQVEGSSNNTITLNGLRELTYYRFTVRAYQQLLGPASSTISVFTPICQQEVIFLMHDGNCYPHGSYFWDSSVNAVTEAISCVLAGTSLTTGQWVRVADTDDPVDCNSNSASDPFRCTNVTSPNATLNLYLAQGLGDQEGWYKCCLPTDCSDPNTNIIFANIFRYAEIESFTVADLPSDITLYPQEYKLKCTKIGHYEYGISMNIGSIALASYTNCNDQYSNCPGTVLVSNTNTIRYTVDITWDGMTVSSGSINQSTTGDQMYQCILDNPSGADRIRTLTIKVPAIAPSSLTEVSKTATTITVRWTALDSSDADGYVVNVTSDTDTVQTVQVEGSSNNAITLNGLNIETNYSITVRAYQQLLGPASSTISVQTLPVINSINWTLVSSITQLNNTQYRIDCLTTTDIISPSVDVYWLVNGVMKSNSMYTLIDVLTYNNTLLVYPDPLGVSVNVTCIAMIGGVNYSQSVILHAPSSSANNVRGFILNANSIKVNWTNSSETNGHVIEYTTGGVMKNVVSTSEDEIILTDLLLMSTYTISVYSYIDIPSVNSTVAVLRFDVPSPVTSLSVSNVSTTGITVNWTIPSSDNYVAYYTISYTPSCPQLSSVNEIVSVGPHQSTTTYSYTLLGLYSGMNYTITVRAGNVLGGSDPTSISDDTVSSTPIGVPDYLTLLLINNLTWNEVNCSERNGLITGYTVMISNSSITYNLTSTERYIILNDLVLRTEYNISVAAVNSVGRGPFSYPIVVEIGLVPGPVGSVSSIMDTTWAVISWSVPSYIPSDYPIITYEIGYHILQFDGNCLMISYDDFNTEILQLRNSTDKYINITGVNDESYFIFGVRAYTVNGYGEWTVITNETLRLQLSSNCATSDSVIALSVLVGILCGLLTVSVVVHIYCFVRYLVTYNNLLLSSYRKKSACTCNKQTKVDDDIAMQVCEPYEIHKTKQSEENEGVYDECQTSPDD